MTTVQKLALQVFEEWVDADRPDAQVFIAAASADAVPVMTTMLFQMVVDDNTLAFLDSPYDESEPFRVLHSAIVDEVERLALELVAENSEVTT